MSRTFAGYELIEVLGSGGMGTVWLARHQASGARHALKLVDATGAERVARFQREVEAQARGGAHPNVVTIHTAGVEHGRLYCAMELLAGGDLAKRLAGGALPAREAAAMVAALARGLGHLHAQGVLHRDLKPANVLFDERGTPKLTDFGLAFLRDRRSLTESGTIMGTPAYMSPEQVTADARSDERSDVYGLGAILYHALTGRPPYSGASALVTLQQVLAAAPPPASVVSPGVPVELDAICRRAMARVPADRFKTAALLAEALERAAVRDDRPLRRRWPVALGLVALVIGGLAIAAPNRSTALPRPAAPVVVAPSDSRSEERPPPRRTRERGVPLHALDRDEVGLGEHLTVAWSGSQVIAFVRELEWSRWDVLEDRLQRSDSPRGPAFHASAVLRDGPLEIVGGDGEITVLGDPGTRVQVPLLIPLVFVATPRVLYAGGRLRDTPGRLGKVVAIDRSTWTVRWSHELQATVYGLVLVGEAVIASVGSEDSGARGERIELLVWSASGHPTGPPRSHPDPITALVATPQGELLLGTKGGGLLLRSSSLDDDAEHLFTPREARVEVSLMRAAHIGAIRAILPLRDGRLIVVSGQQRSYSLDGSPCGELGSWSLPRREPLSKLTLEGRAYHSAALSPDETRLVVGRRDGGLELWDVADILGD